MMLKLTDITAGYSNSNVIHNVNMQVDSGEIVCLLGPNGAGKSTVLKSIFQIANVHSGKIEFRGEDITELETHDLLQLGISFVPQGRINFQGMTIRENLEMGGFLLRDISVLKKNISSLLDRFPILEKKKNNLAASLSGGEAQILAIARGLVMNPTLLLLDEPSLGLAPKAVAEIFDGLKSLVEEGMTILVVEQNVHLALNIADRGYLLASGKIAFSGSADELKDPNRMRELYLGD
jgi:branched-chain amino acid transport system ATP-binding protein